MESHQRSSWLAKILKIALDQEICSNHDVLRHVDHESLALYLPKEAWGQVFVAGLNAGRLTPDVVLGTVTFETLATHVPHDLLWVCVAEAAYRSAQNDEDNDAMVRYRSFLKSTLEAGFDSGVLRADRLIQLITFDVFAHCLPVPIRAELLRACLAADGISNEFIIETLGLDSIATYVPVGRLWAVIADTLEESLLQPSEAGGHTLQKDNARGRKSRKVQIVDLDTTLQG